MSQNTPIKRLTPSNPAVRAARRPGGAALLAAGLVALLLAGCNDPSDSGAKTDASSSQAGAAGQAGQAEQPRMKAQAVAINPAGWVAVPAPNDVLLQNLVIPADAPTRGMWSAPAAWPMVGVNQALLPNGKVLTWGTTPDGGAQNGRYFDIWDPDRGLTDPANHLLTFDAARQDSFCAPATFVADGRLMITGGNGTNTNGTTSQFYTTPSASFAQGPSVADARWYGAMVTLADGRSMMLGGLNPYTEGQYNSPDLSVTQGLSSMTPEVFENGAWRSLFGAQSRTAFGPDFLRASLPKVWTAPDGRVFGIGTDQMYYVDANAAGGNGAITIVGGYKTPPQPAATNDTAPNVGPTMSGVMYAPGKVMTVGGNSYHNGTGFMGSRKATSIDLNGGGAVLTELPNLAFPRQFANTLALPDGKVLVTGGETRANNDPAFGVFAAELWSPVLNTWTTMASSTVFRAYHSQSALLPNGTVLVTGGGNPGPVQLKGDVFYPPYLFRTVGTTAQLAPRPRLIGISGLKQSHGAQVQFDLAGTGTISQVALIGLSVGTHSFNAGQRRIPMAFTQDTFRITATVPNANLVPPGYYQLVAVDSAGVPSRGTIIAVGANVSAPPVPTAAYTPPDTAGTTPTPVGPQPPAAAIACGAEGQVCTLPAGATATVWFGAGSNWVSKTGITGSLACTVAAFGSDPAVGTVKACRFEVTATGGGGGPSPIIIGAINAPVISAGGTASYTVAATAGVSYSWTFGDGSAATPASATASISHVFANPGVYGVTVTARTTLGTTATRSFLQAVRSASTVGKPSASSATALEARANASARLWVVNPDNDSVSVIDTATNARVAEVNVGKGPRSVAVAPDGRVWVSNKDAASISVVSPATLAVVQTINLPVGSQPHGIAFAQAGSAYGVLEATGQLLKLDPTTGATQATLAVGPNVRHVSVSGDGALAFVSRFITPPLPGESTAVVNTATAGAEVVVVNTATMTLNKTVVLRHSDKVDNEVQGAGIPNYLAAAVVSPDGKSAWVPSKQDNIKRGLLRNAQGLTFQNTVRAISSRIDLATLAEDYARRVDHDNASLASAAAYHPTGAYLFVTLETSRQVAVLDAVGGRELLKVDVGRAPQAVAVSADGLKLYVQNFMDRSVTVLDLNPLIGQGLLTLPVLATVPTVAADKLPAQVLLGKQLFYDARDTRLARDSYMSCAACHSEAGHDGRTWDFTGFGEGLRNTPSLKGRAGIGQGFVHWSANFDEIQDFEGQIRSFAGGTGLMSDAQFNTGTRNTPLGDRKAGISADLDALAAYLGSLNSFDPSPNRNADGTLTAAAAAGKTVFTTANCASCHGGNGFTGSTDAGTLKNVGTLKASSGQRLGAALTGLDTPTLRDVWKTAPYLHDGSAPTLAAAVQAHQGNTVAGADLTNLVAYLQQIGSQEPGLASPPAAGLIVAGRDLSFEAMNVPGQRLRHAGFNGFISAIDVASPDLAKLDSTFTPRAGLGQASCWSFEAKNYPGFYLRQAAARLTLAKADGTVAFNRDATYCARSPLNPLAGAGAVSLESLATPGAYIRHRGFEVWVDPQATAGPYPSDASFKVVAPWPLATATAPPATAVACAAENATCTLPAGATATVWYGAGTVWVARVGVTGSIACSNATFGDPVIGVVKACRYALTTAAPVNLAPAATLATSYVSPWESLPAVNNNITPLNSADKNGGAYGNWQGAALYGRTDWVSFSWPAAKTVSAFEVYWWNDGLGIATPTAARVEYWNGTAWVALGSPGLALNTFNRLNFAPVSTTSIRVAMSSLRATGILEARVLGN